MPRYKDDFFGVCFASFATKPLIFQKQPPEVFYKKVVLKNFRNIHRKTPVLESLFNKVASLGLQLF